MPDNAVPSPCTDVCRMDARGRCEGCLRTLDEIAGWSTMSDAEKHAVWDALALRAAGDDGGTPRSKVP